VLVVVDNAEAEEEDKEVGVEERTRGVGIDSGRRVEMAGEKSSPMKMERAGTKGCKNKRTNKPKHNNRSK
jgi:hypothetical protein